MDYLIVKWIHVLSSTLLFGTGIGSAFFLFMASLRGTPQAVAFVSRHVVIADWAFTLPTALLQPATGFYLMHRSGLPLSTGWIRWSLVLYGISMLCWIVVLRLQMRMRDAANTAAAQASGLPAGYFPLFLAWVALGTVALLAFLTIFLLMVARPA